MLFLLLSQIWRCAAARPLATLNRPEVASWNDASLLRGASGAGHSLRWPLVFPLILDAFTDTAANFPLLAGHEWRFLPTGNAHTNIDPLDIDHFMTSNLKLRKAKPITSQFILRA